MMGAIQKGLNEIFQKDPFQTGAEVLSYKNEQSAVRLKNFPALGMPTSLIILLLMITNFQVLNWGHFVGTPKLKHQ